jgi:hypothetical protein
MNIREQYVKNADSFLTEEPMSYDEEQVREITNQAIDAFWNKVVEMIPEARSGDIDPMAVQKMENFLTDMVKYWIQNNL